MSLDANYCCYPQSWWGWWQWAQYAGGVQICQINCGNCICTGSGAAPRGLAGDIAAMGVIRVPADHPYCDLTVAQRTGRFIGAVLGRRFHMTALVGRNPGRG